MQWATWLRWVPKRSVIPMSDVFADGYDLISEEIAETIGSRNGSHGDPIENHEHIADLWSAYLGVEVSATDVAACMILLKLCRFKIGGQDRDHWRDSMGYAEIANMIQFAQTNE